MAFRSLKRTHDMFLSNHGMPVGISEAHESQRIKLAIRARDEYGAVIDGTAPVASDAPAPARVRSTPVDERASTTASAAVNAAGAAPTTLAVHTKRAFGAASPAGASSGGVLAIHQPLSEAQIKQSESRLPPTQKELDELHARLGLEDAVKQSQQQDSESGVGSSSSSSSKKAPAGPDMRVSKITGLSADQQRQLAVRQAPTMVKPTWHPPWKLMRVISGHQGWVHSIAVDPTNEWFVTGSRDRTIKVWDLASGTLRLTLTGHISTVRRLAISDRQPYLFSVGEDKMVRCWDLEQNKTIRHYHGHLSAVYALALHPKQDVLVTGGRDSTVRVWDMRTCLNVHTLTGHTNTVNDIVTQAFDPQIVSASQDSTVRLWDLRMGRSLVTLTNHKKGVRALAMHEKEFTFVSASPDNIKQWKFPNGDFMQNLSGHRAIINTLALNADNVLVSGGNDGSLHFYDYHSGAPFQTLIPPVQPGSLEAEAGVLCSAFDKSGSRLITGESDKSIKIFKEDDTATEESHPVVWHPGMKRSRF